MSGENPDVLILMGSPRSQGASAQLARAMSEAFEAHGIEPTYFPLSDYPVAACNGCDNCATTGECSIVSDPWHVLSRHLDSADVLVLVAPVYFSGPSAHLKAALDRCQVYWARRYRLNRPMPPLRPAHLLVTGEAGDPHGFDPLVTICTSALNSTGLRLDGNVHDFRADAYDLACVPELTARILGKL